MIVTIRDKGLTIPQLARMLPCFLKIGLEIEKQVRLSEPATDWDITLAVEALPAPKEKRLDMMVPAFHVCLVAPCEIISFDPKATMATRIVAFFPFWFVPLKGKQRFQSRDDGGRTSEISRERIITDVSAFLSSRI